MGEVHQLPPNKHSTRPITACEVTRAIQQYFALHARATRVPSNLGAQLDAIRNRLARTPRPSNADNGVLDALVATSAIFADCDALDMRVLAERYWCQPDVDHFDGLVAGAGAGTVRLAEPRARHQAVEDCARRLSLPKRQFERHLTRARQKVRRRIARLRAE